MTPNARDALETLRSAAEFNWAIVPILVIVIWLYANEVERRRWGVVFGGLALLAADEERMGEARDHRGVVHAQVHRGE